MSSDVNASLFIKSIDGYQKLAEQIQLSASVNGNTVTKTLSQVVDGDFLSLGTIGTGTSGTTRVTFTMEFLNLPENNSVMNKTIGFTMGITGMENP